MVYKQAKLDKLSIRQKRIYDFLSDNDTAVLSTVGKNGQPDGSVVFYAVDEDFSFVLAIKKNSRKYTNLIDTKHAVLTIFTPVLNTVARVEGEACAVKSSSPNLAKSKAKLMHGKSYDDTYAIFTICPSQIHLAVYNYDQSTVSFDSIESFDLYDEILNTRT